MKTLIFKSILIVGIALGIANYVFYLNSGKMLIDGLSSIELSSMLPSKSDIRNAVSVAKEIPSDVASSFDNNDDNEQAVYKWIDANGKVHYSSKPPEETTNAREVAIDPNQNIVQRVDTKPKVENKSAPTIAPTSLDIQTYSPETIEKLVNDAKEVQTLMNERTRKIEEAAN